MTDASLPPPPASNDEQEKAGNVFSKYYSQLSHQQNMLTDAVRTRTYRRAMFDNASDFRGSTVVDVGAGSGILCFFAAQAGAEKVWGVEMSDIAVQARKLVEHNGLQERISIVKGKVEEVSLEGAEGKVDIIVSEPLGFALVHERMLESYIVGRDRFLKPGGKMFPTDGTIFTAPFTDEGLYDETYNKVHFWTEQDFLGVDVSCMHAQALGEAFSQPVVGYFNPSILLSADRAKYRFDFRTCTVEELKNFEIPFSHVITRTAVCHGIACWFDCDFIGSAATVTLRTGPEAPGTHWYQCRMLLQEPVAVNKGQTLKGSLKFDANDSFSYDVRVTLEVPGTTPTVRSVNMIYMQDQCYHYLYAEESAVDSQGMGHVKGNESQYT
mmetsp:Transcript_2557/g.4809  ORF Transcript_2557/g.4809 Transcript_2557/m.4809 type:complete len:382 (+) Transcript_2557:160-1305(+)|eukprot:CAMPEP_0182454962 /NCGR_PEP_ID=MMETSP1319-20130603/1351_1 /TAXON_ID=172717 /ORGANISM="Bolidomonas pacifica, Strain RCC208" /LENGTH=381 /DNA_ID=CAMNT_0024652991 /DNA_START=159 /DNA_END=1304 /DNA_ORIENTATION=-